MNGYHDIFLLEILTFIFLDMIWYKESEKEGKKCPRDSNRNSLLLL